MVTLWSYLSFKEVLPSWDKPCYYKSFSTGNSTQYSVLPHVGREQISQDGMFRCSCFINNDYVTAEIIYSIAHANMTYSFGYGLLLLYMLGRSVLSNSLQSHGL